MWMVKTTLVVISTASHLENDRNVFREQEILHCLGFHKNLVIYYGVFNFESRLFSVTKQPITNLLIVPEGVLRHCRRHAYDWPYSDRLVEIWSNFSRWKAY